MRAQAFAPSGLRTLHIMADMQITTPNSGALSSAICSHSAPSDCGASGYPSRLCSRSSVSSCDRSGGAVRKVTMIEVLDHVLSGTVFEPEIVQMLASAFEDAWERLEQSGRRFARPGYARAMREVIARRIVEMCATGRHGPAGACRRRNPLRQGELQRPCRRQAIANAARFAGGRDRAAKSLDNIANVVADMLLFGRSGATQREPDHALPSSRRGGDARADRRRARAADVSIAASFRADTRRYRTPASELVFRGSHPLQALPF
jgi:hypothetical protein